MRTPARRLASSGAKIQRSTRRMYAFRRACCDEPPVTPSRFGADAVREQTLDVIDAYVGRRPEPSRHASQQLRTRRVRSDRIVRDEAVVLDVGLPVALDGPRSRL